MFSNKYAQSVAPGIYTFQKSYECGFTHLDIASLCNSKDEMILHSNNKDETCQNHFCHNDSPYHFFSTCDSLRPLKSCS